MKVLLGFSALCVACLLLGMPLAYAGTFSATANEDPGGGIECLFDAGAGGAGFASISFGPHPCASTDALGSIHETLFSGSGSWVTGDLSVSTEASVSPTVGFLPSQQATGMVVLKDAGVITLPSGMASASITFGVTGLSGTANSDGDPGHQSSGDIVELDMISGASSATSVACLMNQLFHSSCPGGGFGEGLGPGALAPITLTVSNGELLQLTVSLTATAYASAFLGPGAATASISVDPLFLTLPAGATFDSGIPGFLSGPAPGPVPEPATLALLGVAFAGMCLARGRKLN